MVHTQFDTKIKCFKTDNAFELGLSHEATAFFHEVVILRQTCIRDTPQQNGIVERKIKYLLETFRSLIFQSQVPLIYLGECLLAATYLINRIPTKILSNTIPFELLFGKIPIYHYLKSFGCLCYVSTQKRHRDKFHPRASSCVFLGYPYSQRDIKSWI